MAARLRQGVPGERSAAVGKVERRRVAAVVVAVKTRQAMVVRVEEQCWEVSVRLRDQKAEGGVHWKVRRKV